MARIVGEVPSNKSERRVFESLGHQLDDTWLIASNVRYASKEGRGSTVDREIDILVVHPRRGIFVIEIKGGVLKRDPAHGWLHWKSESGSMEPTNAFKQAHGGSRSLLSLLKAHKVPRGYLSSTPYVVFVDVSRPNGPVGPEAEPMLIFGDEIDSILKRIEKDTKDNGSDQFTMADLERVLFPGVEPKVYESPSFATVDISAIEALVAQILEQISQTSGASTASMTDLRREIEAVRSAIKIIPTIDAPRTSENESELVEIKKNLDRLAIDLASLVANSNNGESTDTATDGSSVELKNEIREIKDALEGFSRRVTGERQAELERVESGLSSLESSLEEIKNIVGGLKNASFDAGAAQNLGPVLSAIGVLTARMAQLSKAVGSIALPAERFDTKLDRLASLYRDVSDRLERTIVNQKSDDGEVHQLRREMHQLHERLAEIANRPLLAPVIVDRDGTVVVRSRLSPGLVAATIVAVLAVGVAVTASRVGNGGGAKVASEQTSSNTSSVVTLQSSSTVGVTTSEVSARTTSSLVTISEVGTTEAVSTSTSQDSPVVGKSIGSAAAAMTLPVATGATAPSRSTTTTALARTIATTVPAPVRSPLVADEIALGEEHSCVLEGGGGIYCWGSNEAGQLGTMLTRGTFSASPVKVAANGKRFALVSSGRFHSCAIAAEGDAYCWGLNATGQLGVGSSEYAIAEPTLVVGGLKFREIHAGAVSTCGLTVDKRAFCWGRNADNEVGRDVGYSSNVPVEVAGGWLFDELKTGSGGLTCGIESSGRVLCWGEGGDYFGPDELNLYASTYVGATLGVGKDHMCLVKDGSELRCYSAYSNDALGVGSDRGSMGYSRGWLTEPLVSIFGGFRETCGLTSDGRAYCWGARPALVATDKKFSSLSLFGSRKCGVTTQHQVYCWGIDADGRGTGGMLTDRPALVTLNAQR